ncbi:MAG: hypothetical protein M1832_003062 [Thelocarpon impressellum]|nr:MAG: hypothetical protein M1832_003062 [Thelocarpon impressellum]
MKQTPSLPHQNALHANVPHQFAWLNPLKSLSPHVQSPLPVGLFADPRSMDCLTKEQKERLALHLPEHLVHESPEDGFKSIPPDFLRYNNDWRHGVRLFQEDLAAGRYDPAWQEEAADAMENRAHGDYDDFKLGKFEAFWGQNQKLAKEATAGGSAKIKLDLLSREDVFRVGDVWSFSRTVTDKKTKVKITVEKEALVCGKSGPEGLLGLLDFTFPPGQHKFSNPNIREDVKVTNISGPQSLETAIFKEDGRVEAAGNGNAWKVFRVLRNNQDLGLIWDMREAFWLKRGEEDEKAERTGIPNRERRKRGQGSQQSFEDEV